MNNLNILTANEEIEDLDDGHLGYLDQAEYNIVQSNVAKFKTLVQDDNLQEWTKVSFLVQYCCCVIFLKLGTSVLGIQQDPKKAKMSLSERVAHYVRYQLPQEDLFTQFMDGLPITVKRNKKPYRYYKAASFRLLELYAMTGGQGFHEMFRNCLFFSDTPSEAHTNINLCKNVLGPAVARFMTRIQSGGQAPSGMELPTIPTVQQVMVSNYGDWLKTVQQEDGHILLTQTVHAVFGMVNNDDVRRAQIAHHQRCSPAPSAANAIGTTARSAALPGGAQLQLNALSLSTPTSLTPRQSQGSASTDSRELSFKPVVIYTNQEMQQQIYAAWFHSPQQAVSSPELARKVSMLATKGVARYPIIDAYLEVAEWASVSERRFSSATLHTVMAADFCSNGRLRLLRQFSRDHYKTGHPQLFPLKYREPQRTVFPNEQKQRQLHDPKAASMWANLGPLPKLMSRGFDGSEREMDTPTALFNAQRTLANIGTYTNVSSFPNADLAKDCEGQAVLLPALPPYLEKADASSLLLLRRRALLLLSTGASRQLTYRREDLLLQVNQGTLAVVAFNEATRTTLGGVSLQEHQTDWHHLPNSEASPADSKNEANLEAMRALDALIRETAGGDAPRIHRAYFAVMVRAGQQLLVPAGFWVAYTACTGVVGTLYSPIDGSTMARTTHTLVARPLPATPHLRQLSVPQRMAQRAVITAIRDSLWVAGALIFSHQACLRYMLRALKDNDAYPQRTDKAANKHEMNVLGSSASILLESYYQLKDTNVGTTDELSLVTHATGPAAPSEAKLTHHAPGLEKRELLPQIGQAIAHHSGVMPRRLALSPLAVQVLQAIADMGATTHALSDVTMRTLGNWVRKGKRAQLTPAEQQVLQAYQRPRPHNEGDDSSDSSSSSSTTAGSNSSDCATDSDASMSTDDQGYSESNTAFVNGGMQCLLDDGSVPMMYRLQAYNEIKANELPTRNGARSRFAALGDGRFYLEQSALGSVEAGSPPPNQLQKQYNMRGFFVLQEVIKEGLKEIAQAACQATDPGQPRPLMQATSARRRAMRDKVEEMTQRLPWVLNKYRRTSDGHFRVIPSTAAGPWERPFDFHAHNEWQLARRLEPVQVTYESMPALCLLALTPASIDVLKMGTVTLSRGTAMILRGDTAYRHTGALPGTQQAFYGVYLDNVTTKNMRRNPAVNEKERRDGWQQKCTEVHNDVQTLIRKRAAKTARLERYRPPAALVKAETFEVTEEQMSEYLANDSVQSILADTPWVSSRMTEEDYSFLRYCNPTAETPPSLQDIGLSDGDEYNGEPRPLSPLPDVNDEGGPPASARDDFEQAAANAASQDLPLRSLRYSPELLPAAVAAVQKKAPCAPPSDQRTEKEARQSAHAQLEEKRLASPVRPQHEATGTTLRGVALALADLQPPVALHRSAQQHWSATMAASGREVTVAAVALSAPLGTAGSSSPAPSPVQEPSRLLPPPMHDGTACQDSATTADSATRDLAPSTLSASALEDGELADNEACSSTPLRSSHRPRTSSRSRNDDASRSERQTSLRYRTRSSRARSPPPATGRNNGKAPNRQKRQKTQK